MVCIKCGKFVSNTAKFCENCGAQLLGIDDSPSSVEPIPVPSVPASSQKKDPPMPSWLLYGLLILCIPLYFFACTATSSSSDPEPNKFEYIVMAESFVEDILKAPSTAEFCPAHECSVSATDEGLVVVRGYVDAENSFGAMLRSDYAVEMLVDDDSDKYTLVYLMFGTEEVGTYISGDFNLLK